MSQHRPTPSGRIRCAVTTCANELLPDARHVDNLTAVGWRCHEHRDPEPEAA